MKVCSTCKQAKDESEFGKHTRMPDGLRRNCKPCQSLENAKSYRKDLEKSRAGRRAAAKNWQSKNPDRAKQIFADWYAIEANRLRTVQNTRRWILENPERKKEADAAWNRANRPLANARRSHYKAMKRKAIAGWSIDFFVQEAYALALERTKKTGIEWEVDHIVPIRSSRVCGLHTHNNLAVITARLNSSKGNRYWPDMPTNAPKELISRKEMK